MDIVVEKVCTDDFTMNFFRFGNGSRSLIILPGLSIQSVMKFAPAIVKEYELMKADFTVWVFDRRIELPSEYTVYDMAKDTVKAINALGLDNIYLFGASQGGMIAQIIAADYPELVYKMVLASTCANMNSQRYSVLSEWVDIAKRKDRVGLYLEFGKKIYPEKLFEQYRETLILAGNDTTDEELERFVVLTEGSKDFDVTDKLCNICCPVLVTGSYDDGVFGEGYAPEITNKLISSADVKMYMYDGYGHAAFDTAPDYRKMVYKFFME